MFCLWIGFFPKVNFMKVLIFLQLIITKFIFNGQAEPT